MSKSKEEIKKELNDAKAQLKDGIEKVNKDYKINSQERKRKTEEKKNKEREEYAKTKKVNYCSNTAWETMNSKKLKIINILLKCLGGVFFAFGLIILFGAGEMSGILVTAIGLYFLFFDPRKFSDSSKK
ncbi:hypothetical protein GCM10008904_09760 [Paraclostridium ghonii]|uniref:Zn-dependent protease n=1 Tax=Paraclostridium ghonii TaxID=29358 RepID=A0ABU0MYR4_9FIRM|nr:hypothetical protein [Paeniclostridium ghonii]MDQ0555995.1 putative Zn-dependent protease [Paeniclostridium ghonii]